MDRKKDEFEEIIKESGHSFHLEVVEILRKAGWEVEISPYYYDEIDNKPREIDIIATKLVSVESILLEYSKYKLNLFIECKHLDREIVFWTDKIDFSKVNEAINNSILYLDINAGDFKDNQHHYLRHLEWRTIAKLFETKQKEKGSSQDIIFSAFTQAIKSLIFFRAEKQETGIYYPMVIYEPKNKIAVYGKDKPKRYELKENILLEVNYSYKSREVDFSGKEFGLMSKIFLVDFINKDNLESFLGCTLNDEIREINEILRIKSYQKLRQ